MAVEEKARWGLIPPLQVFLQPEKSSPGGQLKTVWYFSAGVTYVVDAPHFNWEYKTKLSSYSLDPLQESHHTSRRNK